MKSVLVGLRIGDVIKAKVSEQLSSYEYIVSVEGKLLQVQNRTLYQFDVGSAVHLQVSRVQPLEFRLLVPGQRGSRRNLDVSV